MGGEWPGQGPLEEVAPDACWALPGQEAMPGSGFQSEGSERSRPDCTGYSGADFLLAAPLS